MKTIQLDINDLKNLVIVVSGNASLTEKFAAHEMQRYLHEATGTEIPIVNSPVDNRNKFIIGDLGTQFVVDKNRLKHDGFVIHYDDNKLIIFGDTPRGTLNGVYTFLHELGFRWVFPKKSEEIVPSLSILPIKHGTRIINPDLELRGVCIFPVNEENVENLRGIIDWMGKNRFNLLMTSVHRAKKRDSGWEVEWQKVSDQLLPELQKRGIILNIGEHSGRYFFPISYFEEHPEWFALNKEGERYNKGQICYSNEEAIEVLADNYVKYVKEHPETDIIGTWPEDGYGFCQCEKCKEPGTVLKAVNRIAERIEEVKPDLTVEYLSYTEETSVVPADILPRHNMAILVANTRVAEEWLKKSNAVNGRGIYQLHYQIADNTAMRANLPLRFEKTRQDCQVAKEMGSRGIIPFYIGTDTWWRSSLNLYFLSQFSWNTNQDVQNILNDYCYAYYGNAGTEMVKLFEALENMPPVNLDAPPPWPLWQNWPTIKSDFTGKNRTATLDYFTTLHQKLETAKEIGDKNKIPSKRFDTIETFIVYHETMLEAWYNRALAVSAFEQNDTEKVCEHITLTAKYEQQLIELLNKSLEADDGVNGARPDFDFFQNWRLQQDKQLFEMRSEEQQKPFIDENPEVEMFLPGLLETGEPPEASGGKTAMI